jgi:hypothetical protein
MMGWRFCNLRPAFTSAVVAEDVLDVEVLEVAVQP